MDPMLDPTPEPRAPIDLRFGNCCLPAVTALDDSFALIVYWD